MARDTDDRWDIMRILLGIGYVSFQLYLELVITLIGLGEM
jgi:hypothetical protein